MGKRKKIITLTQNKRKRFIDWLKRNGAEILPTTNEYEDIRFKGSETGVIYTSGKCSGRYAEEALFDFLQNRGWSGRPTKTSRLGNYSKARQQLAKRDGTKCFFCCEEMEVEDMTLEHLIPLSVGGAID